MGIGNEFIGDVERLVLNEVLDSKKLFRFSKEDYFSYSFIFEKQITEMFGSQGSILFPSATLALVSFIKTLDLKEKDEVIIPPFSWVADYSAVLFENLKLRFCRIDENMQIGKESIEELFNNKTKIVIIPHLMGRGQQNIEEIAKFCKEKNIILIEDIAQSFGVKINGSYAGSFGDFSFSSFNHHKILSSGDGGIAIVHSKKRYHELLKIHDQGCLIDEKGRRKVDQKKFKKGLSLRVNNLLAGVSLAQLSRFASIKYSILKKYSEILKIVGELESKIISVNEGDIPYTLLLKSKTGKKYPSLMESGWHHIKNIPYYEDLNLPKTDKKNVEESKQILEKIYAIGTGFVDKYYSIKEGIKIDEEVIESNINEILEKIL